MASVSKLYETDYAAWLAHNLDSLRQSRFQDLDIEHLIEEIEDRGRKERGELANRLVILIAHLLKWQFQPAHRSSSWRGSIIEQRIQVLRNLKQSPSLEAYFPQAIEDAYADAVEIASRETGLMPEAFPAHCPYSMPELLDKQFWPE